MRSLQSPAELSLQNEAELEKTGEAIIHETAIVHPAAELGAGVQIGAFSIIGPDATIGDGTVIEPHVIIEPWTTIGNDCRICSGAILGGRPQDSKFKGERSYLTIGDRNIIREYVTIHRATGEENVTVLGSENMVMAYCHIGHNCTLGDGIMMANMVGISGHVIIEDKVVFGGMVGVHQFVRIGKLAMVGGYSKVVQDIPPFMMADGRPTKVYDPNVIGLRRNGVPPKTRSGLRQAYKLLYRSNLNLSQAIETIESEVEPSPERDYLLEFVRNIKFGFAGRQLEHRR
ncbi:MAG TPA: acyl-ACP--UDP-N-acetylglucosamine O-acyltransferase [Armatimonadota bacterium]|nr:acyl-ACP--UDP-N-acetylglucosamine O-acyltransferase [Armatimonadota bacterium]